MKDLRQFFRLCDVKVHAMQTAPMETHILYAILIPNGAIALTGQSMAAGGEPAGPLPENAYLFSYFINNGEDGLHLAWSTDGLNWKALNGGKSHIQTKDFIKWEEQSTKLVVPPGTKHGAALTVPGKVIEKLMARDNKP